MQTKIWSIGHNLKASLKLIAKFEMLPNFVRVPQTQSSNGDKIIISMRNFESNTKQHSKGV